MPEISTLQSADVHFGLPDRVEFHLQNWRDWMQTHVLVDGLPGRCAVVSSGGRSQDFDEMADRSDKQAAKVVDALVSGLPYPQRSAIDAKYLRSHFQFQTDSYADLLERAKERIGRGLAARGVW